MLFNRYYDAFAEEKQNQKEIAAESKVMEETLAMVEDEFWFTSHYINVISNATYTVPARKLATQQIWYNQKRKSAVQRRKLPQHSQYHFLDSATWL